MFVSHTKHTQRKINKFTSFAIDNMYYVSFRILEQESVPWCNEIQKKKYIYIYIYIVYIYSIYIYIRSIWEHF